MERISASAESGFFSYGPVSVYDSDHQAACFHSTLNPGSKVAPTQALPLPAPVCRHPPQGPHCKQLFLCILSCTTHTSDWSIAYLEDSDWLIGVSGVNEGPLLFGIQLILGPWFPKKESTQALESRHIAVKCERMQFY